MFYKVLLGDTTNIDACPDKDKTLKSWNVMQPST